MRKNLMLCAAALATCGVIALPASAKLTAEQIVAAQGATAAPTAGSTAEPAILPVSFKPGVAPKLTVAPDMATAISVFDSAGRIWPIDLIVVGNPQLLQVVSPKVDGNTFSVAPLSAHGATNVLISLRGSSSLVPVTFVTGATEITSRVMRMDVPGPASQNGVPAPATR